MYNIKFNYEYDRKIRVGFIGCGAHAFRNVYPTFDYAPIDLVAVCDLNAERAEIYRKRFGADKAYTSHLEMLKKEQLDAVFVVLNFDQNGHPLYPKIVPDILAAGLPVWIEKPVAYTAEEAERLLELEDKSGQFVLVANKRYFYPTFEKARQILDRPEFGESVSINGRYPLTLSPFQPEINTRTSLHWFLDICHPMSGIHYLMGDVKEMCFIEHQPSGNVQTLLKFKSGAIGSLQLSSTQAETSPLERFEVIGDKQNVVIDNAMRLIYYKGKKGSGEYGKAPIYIGDDPADGPVLWEPEYSLGQIYNKNLLLQGMVQSVNYFASHVLEGKKITRSTLKDSLHLTRIFDAYKKRSDQWITIE
ncbi:Gfo/Idh/MocA family oxidoreductase [Paenibacillus pasadenensis]|uniref:Gfo/Idh/MocA family protein n=1 Tax=Paenibacillus pasadenensis TaxID=217090 RepID=UPI0020406163|nr:Gfo/Idh/MocA family oxidoreductase [Paenibacillus pasadenensis]MCM3746986.1 Gfo/Idh/MocA family oxidoreductase [Paenibacillus pasadenensis]